MKSAVINFIKSIIIGASALIPGVSGGTMAIALGMYDRLLRAVSHFNENIKENTAFLAVFVLGGTTGVLALSRGVLWLFQNFRLPSIYFFIGCVTGSIPMLFRRSGIVCVKISDIAFVLLGYLCVTWISCIPTGSCLISGYYFLKFIMLAAAGAVIAIAFILPGISTSYMLLLLGIYDTALSSLRSGNVAFLAPIFLGALIGTLMTARILENALEYHKKHTYMLIIGFVLGSVFEIIPALPTGINIAVCVFTFSLGFIFIKLILRYTEDF